MSIFSQAIPFQRKLLNDSTRMQAYSQAIKEMVRPGDVVLDVGTGSGILALFACQAGAARVYAVDSSLVVRVAKRLAHVNGFEERITFLEQDFEAVDLPEKVDLIVSELIAKAVLGQKQESLVSLARQRFLKPGGNLIPARVELLVAPIERSDLYASLQLPDVSEYEIDFEIFQELSLNQSASARLEPGDLLAEPQVAFVHQAEQVSEGSGVDIGLSFDISLSGVLHGFGAWFNAWLTGEVGLSNAPPLPADSAWDNMVLPLQQAVSVAPGMRVELSLRGLDTPALPKFWQWDTRILDAPGTDGERALLKSFRQSTFYGEMIAPPRRDS